ncbi:MAG: type II toxin-antitoxin system HicA family toxin [Thermoanaerobaculia bacterium]
MARLRVLSGRDVCEILSRHGFALVRQKGSHAVMQAHGESGTITVPYLRRLSKGLSPLSLRSPADPR